MDTHGNCVRRIGRDSRPRRRTGTWRARTCGTWRSGDNRRGSNRTWSRPTCPDSPGNRRTACSTGRPCAACSRSRASMRTTTRCCCSRATGNSRSRPGAWPVSGARSRLRTARSCVCTAASPRRRRRRRRSARTCRPAARRRVAAAGTQSPTFADSIPRPPDPWDDNNIECGYMAYAGCVGDRLSGKFNGFRCHTDVGAG